MAFWWANQSYSFYEERDLGVLWAPLKDMAGRRLKHWDALDKVVVGDVICHYAQGHVRALGTATAGARQGPRPAGLPRDRGNRIGRGLHVSYRDAITPVALAEIPRRVRSRNTVGGPFQKDLEVKVGYLWPLDNADGEWLVSRFADRFEQGRVYDDLPAEARDDAVSLLRRLIGERLTTYSGSGNTVLAVGTTMALVATDRSPAGREVPVADVDAALRQLREQGYVELTVHSVGYRSAFIGAVLLTLPGATASGSPPRVALTADPDASSGAVTYEGELTRPRTAQERREQGLLRRSLVGAASTATCALCGQEYPVRLLWAAHIKKRSVCTDAEKRDVQNIAMAACLLGCDALYELGFVSVGPDGRLVRTASVAGALEAHLASMVGRRVVAYTPGSAQYFDWHRANIFHS